MTNVLYKCVNTWMTEEYVHLQREKCKFCKAEVEYLGHRINAKGIHLTENKVEAIKEHINHKMSASLEYLLA